MIRPSLSRYEQLAATGWVRRPERDTPGVDAFALPDGRLWLGLTGTLPDPEIPAHPPYGGGGLAPWFAQQVLTDAGQTNLTRAITLAALTFMRMYVGCRRRLPIRLSRTARPRPRPPLRVLLRPPNRPVLPRPRQANRPHPRPRQATRPDPTAMDCWPQFLRWSSPSKTAATRPLSRDSRTRMWRAKPGHCPGRPKSPSAQQTPNPHPSRSASDRSDRSRTQASQARDAQAVRADTATARRSQDRAHQRGA
jgi:hypothetical protein